VSASHRPFKAPPPLERPERADPTFSVVIAAHNAAATIGAAIDSALAQTSRPLEVIVCDDGSTDATAAAVGRYGDRVVFLRKQHSGVASARNAALSVARGEFVAVLDADDAYQPERLEALTELARARPDLDILSTDAFFERDGRFVGRFNVSCPFDIVDQRAAIVERCFCIAPAVRRDVLVAVGGYDESLRTGEDWECAIRLVHAGARAGLVDEPLYVYRVEGETLTSDRVKTLRDRVVFLERVGRTHELRESERDALARSLARQRRALILTQAEAALRARSRDARRHALAVACSRGVPLRSRAAGLAAAIAPNAAARTLDRRAARDGSSRLARSVR
jgi:glycosyltransferase involved in cell wall biosynthesis